MKYLIILAILFSGNLFAVPNLGGELAEKTKYQYNYLDSDVSDTSTTLGALTYTLEAGKTYRITFMPKWHVGIGGSDYCVVEVKDGSTTIDFYRIYDTDAIMQGQGMGGLVHKMVNTSLTFVLSYGGTCFVFGDTTASETKVLVEELPSHEVYTGW